MYVLACCITSDAAGEPTAVWFGVTAVNPVDAVCPADADEVVVVGATELRVLCAGAVMAVAGVWLPDAALDPVTEGTDELAVTEASGLPIATLIVLLPMMVPALLLTRNVIVPPVQSGVGVSRILAVDVAGDAVRARFVTWAVRPGTEVCTSA